MEGDRNLIQFNLIEKILLDEILKLYIIYQKYLILFLYFLITTRGR